MTSKPTTSQIVLKITSLILRLLLNIIFYVIVVMLIISVSKQTYNLCYQIFGQVTASAEPGRDVEIQIKKGESTMNVASKLELNNIIVNKYSFYLKAKLKKYNIMPGTFVVNSSMTYDEIFAIITVPSADASDQSSEASDGANSSDSKNSTDETGVEKESNSNDTNE